MDESQTKGANPPEKRAEPPDENGNKPGVLTKPFVVVIGTIVLACAFFVGLRYVAKSYTHASTDDAFLDANVVAMAPQVAGRVQKVFVVDNQEVKAGDLLVQIDPSDFEVQLAQKKAAVASAEANVAMIKASFDLLKAQVTTAKATAAQSKAEADADAARAEKAESDLKRAKNLLQQNTISQEEFDTAQTAATAAEATLQASQAKATSDQSKVTGAEAQLEAGERAWDRAKAQATEAETEVRQAKLNLSYTKITAPTAGRVTQKSVEPGDYVQIGQRLMAIVPPEIWVTANFKETDLKDIRVNQPVEIEVDSVGGQKFAGHVQSIQSGTGARFSLLPPENAVGNFVKVVQRVPVKIVFDHPVETEHVLGPGMSVVPYVHTSDFVVPTWAVAATAIVLALAVGILWWRKAGAARQAAG